MKYSSVCVVTGERAMFDLRRTRMTLYIYRERANEDTQGSY